MFPIEHVIALIPLGFERTFAPLSRHIYRFRGILFADFPRKRADRRPQCPLLRFRTCGAIPARLAPSELAFLCTATPTSPRKPWILWPSGEPSTSSSVPFWSVWSVV